MSDRAPYRDARVLVTGASGFIGRHLCARLVDQGAEVIALAKDGATPTIDKSNWCSVDISSFEGVRACLERHRPDLIFNVAALVSGDRSVEIIDDFIDVNLIGAVNVMRAALDTGRPRVILCGSMEEAEEGSPDETPFSAYAASKHASRLFGKLFHKQYGLDVIMTRLFMVYGPGQLDTAKLIPYTINAVLSGSDPEYTGGTRSIDWIYVDDVVDGLLLLGARSDASGMSFDIGSGQRESVRGVVEMILSQMETSTTPLFGARQDRGSESERVANWAPLHELTGWQPKTSLASGLKKTIAWYHSELERHNNVTKLT